MIIISVVVVTGGSIGANVMTNSVELLFMNGSKLCSLPNLPEARKLHSQSFDLICGGDGGESSCVEFIGGTRTNTLATPREGHISWASSNGVVLMGHHYQPQATTASWLTEDGGDFTLPGTLPYQI